MTHDDLQGGLENDAGDDAAMARPLFGAVEIGGGADISTETDADAEEEAARLRNVAEGETDANVRAAAFTVLGKFYARRGHIDAACEAFRLALHHNPHETDALAHLFFLGRTA